MSLDTTAVPSARTKKPKEPKATEREMLNLIERMFARTGNGGSGEYAVLTHVRNAAGFNANRTFDAVVIGLWPSRGHDIHVLEVKVDRGDWKRELADPAKAEDAAKVADRFSMVAPRGVIELAEVPATWGFIEASGGVIDEETGLITGRKLRTVRAAPLLRPADECRGPIPRGLLVAMLRAAGAVPDIEPPDQRIINAAVRAATEKVHQEYRERAEADRKAVRQAQADLSAFRQKSGLYWRDEEGMKREADRVRAALTANRAPDLAISHIERAQKNLEDSARSVERVLQQLRQEIGSGQ